MGFPDNSMRRRDEVETNMTFIRGLLICLFAILVSWCFVYGAVRLAMDIYGHFNPKDEIPLMLTETPPATTDFSDIEQTLNGIERQLEKLNSIQEREADRGF
jgi:hypothetical protein